MVSPSDVLGCVMAAVISCLRMRSITYSLALACKLIYLGTCALEWRLVLTRR